MDPQQINQGTVPIHRSRADLSMTSLTSSTPTPLQQQPVTSTTTNASPPPPHLPPPTPTAPHYQYQQQQFYHRSSPPPPHPTLPPVYPSYEYPPPQSSALHRLSPVGDYRPPSQHSHSQSPVATDQFRQPHSPTQPFHHAPQHRRSNSMSSQYPPQSPRQSKMQLPYQFPQPNQYAAQSPTQQQYPAQSPSQPQGCYYPTLPRPNQSSPVLQVVQSPHGSTQPRASSPVSHHQGHPHVAHPQPRPHQPAPISIPTPTASGTQKQPSPAPLPVNQIPPGGAPARRYLNDNVTPVLLEGMKMLARVQPNDPLLALAKFLEEQHKELEEKAKVKVEGGGSGNP